MKGFMVSRRKRAIVSGFLFAAYALFAVGPVCDAVCSGMRCAPARPHTSEIGDRIAPFGVEYPKLPRHFDRIELVDEGQAPHFSLCADGVNEDGEDVSYVLAVYMEDGYFFRDKTPFFEHASVTASGEEGERCILLFDDSLGDLLITDMNAVQRGGRPKSKAYVIPKPPERLSI
jgi:hypothetical protein